MRHCGKIDSSIILSLAFIPVDFDKDFEYADLISGSFFVKFKAKEQKKMGRTWDQDTIDWWKKQTEEVRKTSYYPEDLLDMTLFEGLTHIKRAMDSSGITTKSTIWTRGNLDSSALEHAQLINAAPKLFDWWQVRDVRTAVDLLSGSSTGYCRFNKLAEDVIKHNPIHDCALDAMQLKYYIGEDE